MSAGGQLPGCALLPSTQALSRQLRPLCPRKQRAHCRNAAGSPADGKCGRWLGTSVTRHSPLSERSVEVLCRMPVNGRLKLAHSARKSLSCASGQRHSSSWQPGCHWYVCRSRDIGAFEQPLSLSLERHRHSHHPPPRVNTATSHRRCWRRVDRRCGRRCGRRLGYRRRPCRCDTGTTLPQPRSRLARLLRRPQQKGGVYGANPASVAVHATGAPDAVGRGAWPSTHWGAFAPR